MDKHFAKIAIGILIITSVIFLGLSYQNYKANEYLGVASLVNTDTGSTSLLKLNNLITAHNNLEATTSMAQLNAGTATALAANPTDCSANQFANAIAANGNLTCAALADADIPNTITASNYWALADAYATTTMPQLTTLENVTDIGTITKLDYTQASGTNETIAGILWLSALADPAGARLAVDANGKVIATTTSGTETVNSGIEGQFAYYSADGTAVSGTSTINIESNGNINFEPKRYATMFLNNGYSFIINDTSENNLFASYVLNRRTVMYNASTTNDLSVAGNILGNLVGNVTGTASGNLTSSSINTIAKINANLSGETIASTSPTLTTLTVTGLTTMKNSILLNNGGLASPYLIFKENTGATSQSEISQNADGNLNIRSDGLINLLANEDGNDYLTISAIGNLPTINVVGGDTLTIAENLIATGTMSATNGFIGSLTGDVTGTASGNLTSASIDTIAELNAIMGGEDVASTTWAGASSLITLGTVTTGTWNASTITVNKGGTGLTSLSTGYIPFGSDTTMMTSSSALQFSGSTLTVTYASSTGITATNFYGNWAGDTIAVTKGGTGLSTIAAGGLLYASSSNYMAVLASSTANSVLTINSSGFPAWSIPYVYPAFSIASTTWNGIAGLTASSTIQLKPSFTAETWSGIRCMTDTGTALLKFGDGTNYMSAFTASSTAGLMTPGSNNTFTAGEKVVVVLSNISSTVNFLSCSIEKVNY